MKALRGLLLAHPAPLCSFHLIRAEEWLESVLKDTPGERELGLTLGRLRETAKCRWKAACSGASLSVGLK